MDGITIDQKRYEVSVKGREVKLTPREWQLLAILTKNPGHMIRYEYLYAAFFGPEWESIDSRAISQHLARLRRKIGADRVQTHPTVGLKFVGKVSVH